MTKQEYLTALVETSKSGGFPSTSTHGTCLYRGPDGRKCAVGILFPDDAIPSETDVWTLMDEYSEFKKYIPEGMTLNDLGELQSIHDEMALAMRRNKNPWDHESFVKDVLNAKCFAGLSV